MGIARNIVRTRDEWSVSERVARYEIGGAQKNARADNSGRYARDLRAAAGDKKCSARALSSTPAVVL